jgi:hypothetical protein
MQHESGRHTACPGDTDLSAHQSTSTVLRLMMAMVGDDVCMCITACLRAAINEVKTSKSIGLTCMVPFDKQTITTGRFASA